MTEPFDSSGIPKAHRWELFFCGHCPHVHLVYFDEHDNPITHAVMAASQLRRIAAQIDERDPNFRVIK